MLSVDENISTCRKLELLKLISKLLIKRPIIKVINYKIFVGLAKLKPFLILIFRIAVQVKGIEKGN